MEKNVRVFTALAVFSFSFLLSSKLTFAQSLYFSPPSRTVGSGSSFNTDIVVDTAGAQAAGAGARIVYDPSYVQIQSISTGAIFADYPIAAFDNTSGKAYISGVVSDKNSLFSGSGVMATINWRAVATGTTSASFEFVDGSTVDSNIAVMQGDGDILSSVNSVTIVITQAAAINETAPASEASGNTPSSTSNTFPSNPANTNENEGAAYTYDPIAPIVSQKPKNSLNQMQPTADKEIVSTSMQTSEESSIRSILPVLIMIFGFLFTIIIVLIVVRKILKKKDKGQKPPTQPQIPQSQAPSSSPRVMHSVDPPLQQ